MPTDPTLVAALRDATAAQLIQISQQHAGVAARLDEFNEPSGVSKAQANDHRIVAAVLLAVARMQERGAFLDGGVLPWTLAVGAPGNGEDVVTNAPTLPAALAALLEDAP